jgi:phosphatidylinositol kinase/protein kinase (PI-3  family)
MASDYRERSTTSTLSAFFFSRQSRKLTPRRLEGSSKADDRAAESTKLSVNQQHLKQAWDVSQISTKDEWRDWLHRLSVEFMRESPSHALRACMSLVDVHPPLSKELFNAAFISCWGEMYDMYQVIVLPIDYSEILTSHHTYRKILFDQSSML